MQAVLSATNERDLTVCALPSPPSHRVAAMVKAAKSRKGSVKTGKTVTFTIDCSKPVEDKIMEIASFEKYLTDRIKVAGKTGTWLGAAGTRLTSERVGRCGAAPPFGSNAVW